MANIIDFIQLPSTVHTYSAMINGPGQNTIDGDFNTYSGYSGSDSASGSGGTFQGGTSAQSISQHTFPAAVTIKNVTYKVNLSASSNSGSDNHAQINFYYQYLLVSDAGIWSFSNIFSGASNVQNTSNGSVSYNPGIVNITQTVPNVVGVRIFMSNGGSHHNDNGSHSWDLRCYELKAFGDGPAGFGIII